MTNKEIMIQKLAKQYIYESYIKDIVENYYIILGDFVKLSDKACLKHPVELSQILYLMLCDGYMSENGIINSQDASYFTDNVEYVSDINRGEYYTFTGHALSKHIERFLFDVYKEYGYETYHNYCKFFAYEDDFLTLKDSSHVNNLIIYNGKNFICDAAVGTSYKPLKKDNMFIGIDESIIRPSKALNMGEPNGVYIDCLSKNFGTMSDDVMYTNKARKAYRKNKQLIKEFYDKHNKNYKVINKFV